MVTRNRLREPFSFFYWNVSEAEEAPPRSIVWRAKLRANVLAMTKLVEPDMGALPQATPSRGAVTSGRVLAPASRPPVERLLAPIARVG